jgi:hypothetical protein
MRHQYNLTLISLINFAKNWYYDASYPHRSGYCRCMHPFYELNARGNFDHLKRVSSILVWPQGGAYKHHHFPALRFLFLRRFVIANRIGSARFCSE